LINSRRKDSIGAWCYFPSVPEIASDIDDLGQVIQVFIKSRQTQFLDKYCFRLIDFTLSNCSCDNGGIKTWILPREIKDKDQQKQKLFNQTKWGEGPDVEVVANFIYSLILSQKSSYLDSIFSACEYIRNSQDIAGYWQSRWYFGNYYGTYVCVRALNSCSNKFFSESIQKAINFIINSQNSNGGWGFIESNSDALNTSFCLLTLKLFDSKKMRKHIKRAEQFLCSAQNQDGIWPAVNFIKPRINDPYRSRTLTTAYVLKALTVAGNPKWTEL
jgi:squalene-hopene/tetraprenyl-beta-curcumene cyclase